MYVSNYTFESNASGALLRVYPYGCLFLVTDEACCGQGDFNDTDDGASPLIDTPQELWTDYGIVGFFNSKRRAIDAARFGK